MSKYQGFILKLQKTIFKFLQIFKMPECAVLVNCSLLPITVPTYAIYYLENQVISLL